MKIVSHQDLWRLLSLLVFTSVFSFALAQTTDTMDESLTNKYITAFWNSFNNDLSAGRLDTYLEHWDENAERITPTVHARGIKEIRATYESYLAAYSDFRQTEIRRVVDGNVVVSELITEARNKASGETLTLPNVAIIELNNQGKVVRARVYLDTRKFNPKAPSSK